MRKNKKESKFPILFDHALIIVQLLLSVLIGYLSKKVLPIKYWLIVLVVLVILWVLTYFMLHHKKGQPFKKGVKKLASRIISLILCIVLAIGSSIAYKGFSVLGNITGGKYQTQVISLAVLSNSGYDKIGDLDGKTVGIVSSIDSENTNKALEDIKSKQKTSITTELYTSLDALQSALINGEVDAVLFNEAYRGMIEEFNAKFESQTRIIYQYEIKEVVTNTSNKVNVTKDSFNIYISGIDTYGPVSTVSRSDVNMIVTVNPKTKKILLTSIPRDYYVQLASSGAYDKLTHAGIYGVDESMATLENLLDIDINYYARVNFTSLVTIVDALGGITVNNPEAFTSYHTNTYFGTGSIYLDGESALEFTRERYGLSGGDRARVVNQQRVLTAMLNKMMSSTIITNYSSILNAVSGSFETSLSSDDIQNLIQMQLSDMSSWNIEQISLDGSGSSSTNTYSMPGYSVYVMEPDYNTVSAAKAKIDEVEAK